MPCCRQVEQPDLVKEAVAPPFSAYHFPPLIPLSRLLSIESVQTRCSTHSHLALRVSLSCLGSFSEVTADKFASLISFPSLSIFLRPLAPAIVTRLWSVWLVLAASSACLRYYGRSDSCPARFFGRSSRHELRSLAQDRSPMFVAHHFDTHSTTNHPTSPNSHPFPCSLSPAGSVLDGLGFAHPSQSRQLAWPNRVHLRCGLGVSHSVAPDHASRHRPYSVLLVLSRFNNAGLSPALISAP